VVFFWFSWWGWGCGCCWFFWGFVGFFFFGEGGLVFFLGVDGETFNVLLAFQGAPFWPLWFSVIFLWGSALWWAGLFYNFCDWFAPNNPPNPPPPPNQMHLKPAFFFFSPTKLCALSGLLQSNARAGLQNLLPFTCSAQSPDLLSSPWRYVPPPFFPPFFAQHFRKSVSFAVSTKAPFFFSPSIACSFFGGPRGDVPFLPPNLPISIEQDFPTQPVVFSEELSDLCNCSACPYFSQLLNPPRRQP